MSCRCRVLPLAVIAFCLTAACASAESLTVEVSTSGGSAPVAAPPTIDVGPPPSDADPATTDPATTDAPTTEAAVVSDAQEPTTSETETRQPDLNCRRLTDFDGDNSGWVIVNDGVMGGRSSGFVDFADSAMRFTGTVVTNGGGFTSVRLRLLATELDDTDRIEMRVRADQRTYGLTFEDDAMAGRRSISHNGSLPIPDRRDDDGWATAALRYDALQQSVFGQPVDAEAFDPAEATEIGIIISDGVDGEFLLHVDWIDACTGGD